MGYVIFSLFWFFFSLSISFRSPFSSLFRAVGGGSYGLRHLLLFPTIFLIILEIYFLGIWAGARMFSDFRIYSFYYLVETFGDHWVVRKG